MPVDLSPLLAHVPAWLLVLFRITGIFIFAPLYGSQTIPARVKVVLALGLSACVYPALLNVGTSSYANIHPVLDSTLHLWSLGAMVAAELMIGLVIGFAASLPMLGMQIGGRVIDQQIGLGLAGVFNPDLDEQSGIVGEFFFMLALAVFLILGGHRVLLGTLVASFGHVPLGGFAPDADVLRLLTGLLGAAFELALRVAAPLLCLIFLETVAMGFVARTVPQFNILSIGFPLRILLGALVVVMAISAINGAYVTTMRRALRELTRVFGW